MGNDGRPDEFDRFLRGDRRSETPEARKVRELFESTRHAFSRSDDRAQAVSFAATARDALLEPTEKGEPAAMPASNANGPRREVSGLPKWRRAPVFSSIATFLSTALGKATAAALGLVAATAGLAAGNALPGPAQHHVARIAHVAGVNFPDDQGADVNDQGDDEVTTTTVQSGLTPVTAGDQTKVDDQNETKVDDQNETEVNDQNETEDDHATTVSTEDDHATTVTTEDDPSIEAEHENSTSTTATTVESESDNSGSGSVSSDSGSSSDD